MTTQTMATMERSRLRAPIATLKDAIPLEAYAATLTELRGRGPELRGTCPIHGGDNPTSFSVNVEKQIFCCHACGEGGDLVDLCEAVERHADTWTAVVSLAMRFGVELPSKPERWHNWQNQKAEIRDFNERIRHERRVRRWFRIYHRDDLAAIADPEERRVETERCWQELHRWTPRPDWWGVA